VADQVNKGYRRTDDERLRVVVVMPKDEADAIDEWGVPAGMASRTSAIRFLLRQGLEAVRAKDHRQLAG
jgi:metal-responsive CopG/Arc/MetJ family transcriptional regulator